ncbi:MAG: RluA family pseudouridine synthase [Clostridia bacterium]|nr:RluA family pseudouridine synthase [Clostridia bacterium]
MVDIVYSCGSFAVCIKPRGLVSQGSEKSAVTLLEEQTGSPVYPVHRLDRETEGLMVFALSQKAAAKLSAAIQQGAFSKEYLAVIKGRPESSSGIYEDLLLRDKLKNKTYVVSRKRAGVKEAKLEYTLLEEKEGLSLCRIKLRTGRTHQIRVQFASRGTPLYGDGKYGGGSGDLALYAFSLSFPDPETGKRVNFVSSPCVNNSPWSLFSGEIENINADKTEDSI